jgi:cytochrome c-type biogenesis protein CcmF
VVVLPLVACRPSGTSFCAKGFTMTDSRGQGSRGIRASELPGQSERIEVMKVGDSMDLAGYRLVFKGVAPERGANYQALVGVFEVTRGGSPVNVLTPGRRLYDKPRQSTSEAGIHAAWHGDLYVILGDPQAGDTAYSVRVYFNPLVRLIWIGAVVMFLGGGLSLTDRRLRIGAPQRARSRRGPELSPAFCRTFST